MNSRLSSSAQQDQPSLVMLPAQLSPAARQQRAGLPAAGLLVGVDGGATKTIAAALDLDLSDEVQKERCKGMLEAWIASKALKVLQKPSPTTQGRDRDAVVVGNRIEGEAAQDELEF